MLTSLPLKDFVETVYERRALYKCKNWMKWDNDKSFKILISLNPIRCWASFYIPIFGGITMVYCCLSICLHIILYLKMLWGFLLIFFMQFLSLCEEVPFHFPLFSPKFCFKVVGLNRRYASRGTFFLPYEKVSRFFYNVIKLKSDSLELICTKCTASIVFAIAGFYSDMNKINNSNDSHTS